MKKKRLLILIIAIVLAVAIGVFLLIKCFPTESFSVRPDYPIKLNIPVGGKAISTIKLTNNENRAHDFDLRVINLKGIVELDESKFNLGAKESKEIEITLLDTGNKSRVVLGKLEIKNTAFKKEIPVVLTFESPSHPFAIIQKPIPKYSDVYPGGKLGVDINIFDLGPGYVKEVKAEYLIKDFDNNVIVSSEENLVIDRTYSFSKFFDINKDFSSEDYVLIVSIDYKGLKSISSYLFTLSPKKKSIFPENFNVFVFVVLFFIIVIIGLFFYFLRTRDDLLVQLKKQQIAELKRNVEYIKRSRKEIEKSKEKPEKKKKKLKGLEKVKKNILSKLKQKQKKQRREVHKLRKAKKKDAATRKLEQWKKQGYDIFETGEEVKKVTKKGISEHIKDWKKKGYDVSFLNK